MSKSGNCAICGTWRLRLQRDHIVPLWQGGADDETNTQYICANCHEEKTIIEQQSEGYRKMCGRIQSGKPRSEETREKIRQGQLRTMNLPNVVEKERLAALESQNRPEVREKKRQSQRAYLERKNRNESDKN